MYVRVCVCVCVLFPIILQTDIAPPPSLLTLTFGDRSMMAVLAIQGWDIDVSAGKNRVNTLRPLETPASTHPLFMWTGRT